MSLIVKYKVVLANGNQMSVLVLICTFAKNNDDGEDWQHRASGFPFTACAYGGCKRPPVPQAVQNAWRRPYVQ